MGRPLKQGVDYFPHVVVSGKTLFTLESKFGNDGYAFWFKLLELLGAQEGHVYDARNPADWHYLLAKTRVDEVSATEILDLLVELGAIDAELWQNHRLIWVQKFVDRLSEVYRKRGQQLPQKPLLSPKTQPYESFRDENPTSDTVSAPESTQSKVNKSKDIVDGDDVSLTACAPAREEEPPEELTPYLGKLNEYIGMTEDLKHEAADVAGGLFESYFDREPTQAEVVEVFEHIASPSADGPPCLDDDKREVLEYAFREASRKNALTMAYVNGVMSRICERGLKTAADCELYDIDLHDLPNSS